MAYELHSLLVGAVNMETGERIMPVYGGGSESFLNNVVFHLYKVIHEVQNVRALKETFAEPLSTSIL